MSEKLYRIKSNGGKGIGLGEGTNYGKVNRFKNDLQKVYSKNPSDKKYYGKLKVVRVK